MAVISTVVVCPVRYPTNYSSKLDLQSLRRPSPSSHRPITAYGASKLCNLLFALEFHRRYVEKGVACNVVHPGNLLPTGMAGKAGLFYRMGFALARPFTKSVVSATMVANSYVFLCNILFLLLFCYVLFNKQKEAS